MQPAFHRARGGHRLANSKRSKWLRKRTADDNACAKLQKLELALSLVITLAVGFAAGWILASRTRASNDTELRNAFQALAASTLRSTTDEFLKLADQKIGNVHREAALDLTRKLPAYARAGVSHVWLIDPAAHTLEIFQRVKRGWLLVDTFEGEAIVRAEPFSSLPIELSSLWMPTESFLELVR